FGQPRPRRRTSSRISRAPPPYIGASATSAGSMVMGRLPSRNSATSGARKNRPMAGAMRRIMPLNQPPHRPGHLGQISAIPRYKCHTGDDEPDHPARVVAGVVVGADAEVADAAQELVGIHVGADLA